jgi:hypothetical protein
MNSQEQKKFNDQLRDIYIEEMAKSFAKQIELDYKEFLEANPNGKEDEYILFVTNKYK